MSPPTEWQAALLIARFALRESLRRRVFLVIALLTLAFLVLYGLAAWQAFEATGQFGTATSTAGVDTRVVVGATLAGLAMFAILFLATILAVFLTLGAVRGDAEPRAAAAAARAPAAPADAAARPLARRRRGLRAVRDRASRWPRSCSPTRLGGWWPDRVLAPLAGLGLGVAILAAISLAGSVVLASTANGIGVFMLFGAGLTAGLLGQIAEAIGSDTLGDVAKFTTWALPFEALYQAGLAELTADTVGITKLALSLGPFGGAPGRGSRPLVLLARVPGRGRRARRPRLQRARSLAAGLRQRRPGGERGEPSGKPDSDLCATVRARRNAPGPRRPPSGVDVRPGASSGGSRS